MINPIMNSLNNQVYIKIINILRKRKFKFKIMDRVKIAQKKNSIYKASHQEVEVAMKFRKVILRIMRTIH